MVLLQRILRENLSYFPNFECFKYCWSIVDLHPEFAFKNLNSWREINNSEVILWVEVRFDIVSFTSFIIFSQNSILYKEF